MIDQQFDFDQLDEDDYNYGWNDQDLRILKQISVDSNVLKEFTKQLDYNFFTGKCKDYAQYLLQYVKLHGQIPTKRILQEIYQNQDQLLALFSEVWEKIDQIEVDPKEFQYDLEKVKNRHAQQEFIKLREIGDNAVDWVTAVPQIEQQLNKIKALQKPKQSEYQRQSGREYVDIFFSEYQKKLINPNYDRGVFTGYSYFDYLTNGLRETDLLVIAGESSSGKSMLLNNIAVQMWMQQNLLFGQNGFSNGYDVMYFSLEMPFKNCFRRTLAKMADVSVNGIRDAILSPEDLKKIIAAQHFFKNYPYDFDIVDVPRGLTVERIEEIWLASPRKPKVIFLDYLGLMEEEDNGGGDDWLKLGKIAGKFHEFLRAYNLIGITAVQLNRPPQNKKQEDADLIGMHRIGRSSLIMHAASWGIQIQSRKDEHLYSDFPYHVIKARDGERGSHIIGKNFKNASIIDVPYTPSDFGFGTNVVDQSLDLAAIGLELFKMLKQ